MNDTRTRPRTAILLSTYNGTRFLRPQIESLVAQTCRDWTLFWRDDGSADESVALTRRLAGELLPDCFVDANDGDHLHVMGSFLRLLALARRTDAGFFAFADQDDVWLPAKVARGVAALMAVPPPVPAVYCARQTLVDARLRVLGHSPKLRRSPGFPAALAQNIATGCTVMLNRAAADLVLASAPPSRGLHDWWCYLIVSAAGGRVIVDDEPALLYRQHGANMIGAPTGIVRRLAAAAKRGPGHFMAALRAHVAALLARPDLLTEASCAQLRRIDDALHDGIVARLAALREPGFVRQTPLETIMFYICFVLASRARR